MKLFQTKIWSWSDLWLFKWGVFLFGIIAGACFHDFVIENVWVVLAIAIVLVIKPTLHYFKD
ncbi:MAG: hypothetical protein HQK81_10305 [Desulfovibrionaceae bacterium]|nr:hypothetical protein [Desulfovibrionaceae bacterium]MBF0514433.1 hypothetical protein [Desulfovibrionaceae bacterium]